MEKGGDGSVELLCFIMLAEICVPYVPGGEGEFFCGELSPVEEKSTLQITEMRGAIGLLFGMEARGKHECK